MFGVRTHFGCTPAKSETPAEPAKKQEVECFNDSNDKLYGEALPKDLPALELAEVLKNPKKYTGQTGLLSGYVRQACTKKGLLDGDFSKRRSQGQKLPC